MTHNIIKTENYLLVVDDSEIKEGDWIYKSNSNTLNIAGKGYHNFTQSDAKIIAHLPLNNSPVLEGVPLLPPLEDEQSLLQPKMPVAFECESTQYTVGEMSKLPLGTVNQKPKTTTNPQGQTVLAGKYIY